MQYRKFAVFNITGAISWVASMTLIGYGFGNLEIVKNNFSFVIIGIVIISVLPMVFMVISEWRRARILKSQEPVASSQNG